MNLLFMQETMPATQVPRDPTLLRTTLCVALACLLAACDIPGLGQDPAALKLEADSKATGAACRHALRGIEDCYLLNPKGAKNAIYEGWKEMDLYMRENKLEGQKTTVVAQAPAPVEEIVEDEDEKPKKKAKSKH